MELLVAAGTAIAANPIPLVLGVGSTLMSAGAMRAQGDIAVQDSGIVAAQQERQATAEKAEASYRAMEEARQARLLASKARARGAASGGGVDEGGVLDILEEGNLRQRMAVWGGNQRAATRRSEAAMTRLRGQQERATSRYEAKTTLLQGGYTLFDKYAPAGGVP